MIKRVHAFIQKKELIKPSEKVLVAVSGGVDSMVLAYLINELAYQVSVVHVNFQLRGEASDLDQSFVQEWCVANNLTCFTTRVDTKREADRAGVSIQMAARNLRYEWFEELSATHDYQKIATAHHQNDSFETILLNLTKGTGVKGLIGISPKNGKVIRPLLTNTKEEILEYAVRKKIKWREDASNEDLKYQRNLIRNEVMPLLQKINPSLIDTFKATSDRMAGASQLLQQFVDEIRDENLRMEREERLSMKWFDGSVGHVLILAELLHPYGVHYSLANEIGKEHPSGKIFLTDTHRIVYDRDQLIFTELESKVILPLEIHKVSETHAWGNWKISIEVVAREKVEFGDEQVAYLDREKVTFPIGVRSAKTGDWFIPLGMKGRKKVSDFMIDKKIPLTLKSEIPIFESNGQILWVGGYRIDDRFKMRDACKEVIKIKIRWM